jgi:hypothetical protein
LALQSRRPAALPPVSGKVGFERSAVLPGVSIVAQTWALSAFTIFVALYASHLGLHSVDAPFAVPALVVLTLRTIGAHLFDRYRPRRVAATALAAATAGLGLLALLPNTRALLIGSGLIAVSQALAFPALSASKASTALPSRSAPPRSCRWWREQSGRDAIGSDPRDRFGRADPMDCLKTARLGPVA